MSTGCSNSEVHVGKRYFLGHAGTQMKNLGWTLVMYFTVYLLHRSLALRQFPSTMMALFIRHVMSVPACVLHLQNLSPEVFVYVCVL